MTSRHDVTVAGVKINTDQLSHAHLVPDMILQLSGLVMFIASINNLKCGFKQEHIRFAHENL